MEPKRTAKPRRTSGKCVITMAPSHAAHRTTRVNSQPLNKKILWLENKTKHHEKIEEKKIKIRSENEGLGGWVHNMVIGLKKYMKML